MGFFIMGMGEYESEDPDIDKINYKWRKPERIDISSYHLE